MANAAPVRTQIRVVRAGNIGYGRSTSLVQDGPPPRPPCRAVLPKIGCRPTSVKGHKSSSSSLMSAVSRPFSGTVSPPLRAYFGRAFRPADPSEKDGFRWSVSTDAGTKAPPRHRFALRGHNMATIRLQMKPRRTAIGPRLSHGVERRRRRASSRGRVVVDFGAVGRRGSVRTPATTAAAGTRRGHIVMWEPRCRMPCRPIASVYRVVRERHSGRSRRSIATLERVARGAPSRRSPVSGAVPR